MLECVLSHFQSVVNGKEVRSWRSSGVFRSRCGRLLLLVASSKSNNFDQGTLRVDEGVLFDYLSWNDGRFKVGLDHFAKSTLGSVHLAISEAESLVFHKLFKLLL